MDELFIGLISGTSVDSIDAALLEATGTNLSVRHSLSVPFTPELRRRVLDLASAAAVDFDELGQTDSLLGQAFGNAARALIAAAEIAPGQVSAIGSHGQTIRHRPGLTPPYTIQIGDPNQIVLATGITTVADFRRRDMALGGQGAPLVPAFHRAAFAAAGETRSVINIGGIANLTLLDSNGGTSGFDTGPGNTLLDQWIQSSRGVAMDEDGHWAASGTADDALLKRLLDDTYFHSPAPKSTGPEYFNLEWLRAHAQAAGRNPGGADMQATLAELTAMSIAQAVRSQAFNSSQVFLCGGGSHNGDLVTRLSRALPDVQIGTTAPLGIDPDFVEAAAFAWLARETLAGRPGNVPQATGARSPAVLGAIYPA